LACLTLSKLVANKAAEDISDLAAAGSLRREFRTRGERVKAVADNAGERSSRLRVSKLLPRDSPSQTSKVAEQSLR
jgi:hypothetical protein